MSRWDHILERKPQELKDYVLDQVADQLAQDLRDFPPPTRFSLWMIFTSGNCEAHESKNSLVPSFEASLTTTTSESLMTVWVKRL